jgi:membrane protein implicated in regulation of membrane protease activity
VQSYFVWLIVGFLLVIAEMAAGTFYLLVLGITAFVAAAVAWFGAGFNVQVLVAVLVGLVGCIWVSVRRRHAAAPPMRSLDVGQPVALDSWISKGDRRARVKYRDALWDAHVRGDIHDQPGEVFYITAVHGNTLEVAKRH